MKLTQAALAAAAGVGITALRTAENGQGRLSPSRGCLLSLLEAYEGAIGAGLHLATMGDERSFYSHAGNSSVHHGWETPAALAATHAGLQRFRPGPYPASDDASRDMVAGLTL